MDDKRPINLINEQEPISLSELTKCLTQYLKMYGDLPVRFIDNDGNINDIFNIDLAAVRLKSFDDKGNLVLNYNHSVNLRSTFDYSTLK